MLCICHKLDLAFTFDEPNGAGGMAAEAKKQGMGRLNISRTQGVIYTSRTRCGEEARDESSIYHKLSVLRIAHHSLSLLLALSKTLNPKP